ncbi:hypothetical protein MRB53_039126 [Persea americana]|nr:hypothetical protein MRB53_039126 [Persea americana]
MAGESLETLRRERASLWKAKRLLQRFRGDVDWVPCAALETPHDEMLLHPNGKLADPSAAPSFTTEQPVQFTDAASEVPPSADAPLQGDDGSAEDRDRQLPPDIPLEENAMEGVETIDMAHHPATRNGDGEAEPHWKPDTAQPAPAHDADVAASEVLDRETASETASVSNGTNVHGMTTRARARSPAARTEEPSSPSPSDSASAIPQVHPWFVPNTTLPDRDLGLPAQEAEETRKFLLLYVQKQEQIVRALASLHSGLQKADRLRHFVLQSCKAEAHLVPDAKGNLVTEMSDGEDWYDVADWDLQPWELKDGKLEKGKDEVEDVEEEGRRGPRRGRRVNRM